MTTNFEIKTTDQQARRGVLKTRHGEIQTPVFMPPATRAAIKAGISVEDLASVGSQIILGNTYHLFLRPGDELVAEMGGLHNFMKWQKPILTDSGGFQVFSIKSKKITDEGVFFNSHIDGQRFWLDAEKSINIQLNLDSDILMVFDECPPSKIPNKKKLYYKVRTAVERTTQWAKISLDTFTKKYSLDLPTTERPQLFGIIQGGTFPDLRNRSLNEITDLPFDGFAMGGLAVGEEASEMYKVLTEIVPKMPEEKPRYLMGVGTPANILNAIERGVDMFDCVLPMRNARHGTLYTSTGAIKISNANYRHDEKVLDENCGCPVCAGKRYSKAYLHHLFRVREDLGRRLATIHNLYFYHDMMKTARAKIEAGEFGKWKEEFLKEIK